MPAPSHPLVIGPGWFPDQTGGLERYLRGLSEALAKDGRGHPTVVVIGPVDRAPRFVRAVGEPRQPLPVRLVRIALAARSGARHADLVDSHFALYGFPCLAWARVRRLPLVVHFHGPWADELVANGAVDGLKIALQRRLERAVYRRAAAAVVLSEAFKRVLVERFAIDEDRVEVIAPGVDVSAFSPADQGSARAALDVAPSSWVAVVARRLVPRMGLDVLLRAWRDVERSDRLLLVVGEGPVRSELEAQAASLGIGDVVRFLGRVDDERLRTCLRAGNVAVVPSVALEGFGLVVIEALACGLPVIGTSVGGMAETLERLDRGLVVAAGDAVALAARLNQAVTCPGSLPSPQACRTLAETYSWSRAAQRHRDLFARVLSNGDAGSPAPWRC